MLNKIVSQKVQKGRQEVGRQGNAQVVGLGVTERQNKAKVGEGAGKQQACWQQQQVPQCQSKVFCLSVQAYMVGCVEKEKETEGRVGCLLMLWHRRRRRKRGSGRGRVKGRQRQRNGKAGRQGEVGNKIWRERIGNSRIERRIHGGGEETACRMQK